MRLTALPPSQHGNTGANGHPFSYASFIHVKGICKFTILKFGELYLDKQHPRETG